MDVIDIIRDIIKNSGKTLTWVAKRVGISKQAVSNIVRNGADIHVSTLVSILLVFGYRLEVIKAGEDDDE